MKNLFRIVFLTLSIFLINPLPDFSQTFNVKATTLVIIKGDTANVIKLDTVIKKRCKCDKAIKRQQKKTGEPRTKFGKFLFDVFDIFKQIVPFLHNI